MVVLATGGHAVFGVPYIETNKQKEVGVFKEVGGFLRKKKEEKKPLELLRIHAYICSSMYPQHIVKTDI